MFSFSQPNSLIVVMKRSLSSFEADIMGDKDGEKQAHIRGGVQTDLAVDSLPYSHRLNMPESYQGGEAAGVLGRRNIHRRFDE